MERERNSEISKAFFTRINQHFQEIPSSFAPVLYHFGRLIIASFLSNILAKTGELTSDVLPLGYQEKLEGDEFARGRVCLVQKAFCAFFELLFHKLSE